MVEKTWNICRTSQLVLTSSICILGTTGEDSTKPRLLQVDNREATKLGIKNQELRQKRSIFKNLFSLILN